MNTIITLTDAAVDHIKKMLEKDEKGIGFRLSIKKTGCSGYAYVPNIVSQIDEKDIHFTCDGLDVYVDSAYVELLKDVIVDYVADNVGLKQKRLIFINPNEKNR
jgi:iron-sulfur cluster assembly protein